MADCSFSIPISAEAPVEKMLEKARNTVESQGGTFSGDLNAGSFDVSFFGNKVVGAYTINNQQLEIEITEKPFMVPCAMIESFLKSQLS